MRSPEALSRQNDSIAQQTVKRQHANIGLNMRSITGASAPVTGPNRPLCGAHQIGPLLPISGCPIGRIVPVGSSKIQTEHCVLARPLGRRLTESSDADAPCQPTFDSGLHKIGRQKGQRYRHIDLTYAALLSLSDAFDGDACVVDKLLEPAAPPRDRGDQGSASLSADRTSILGLNGIRHEYLPPLFRRRLVPRDVKGEVTLWAAFASARAIVF